MTVPTIISKGSALNFALTGKQVSVTMIGTVPNDRIKVNSSHRKKSNDNALNSDLPKLSLTKKVTVMGLHGEDVKQYIAPSASQFYDGFSVHRRGSGQSITSHGTCSSCEDVMKALNFQKFTTEPTLNFLPGEYRNHPETNNNIISINNVPKNVLMNKNTCITKSEDSNYFDETGIEYTDSDGESSNEDSVFSKSLPKNCIDKTTNHFLGQELEQGNSSGIQERSQMTIQRTETTTADQPWHVQAKTKGRKKHRRKKVSSSSSSRKHKSKPKSNSAKLREIGLTSPSSAVLLEAYTQPILLHSNKKLHQTQVSIPSPTVKPKMLITTTQGNVKAQQNTSRSVCTSLLQEHMSRRMPTFNIASIPNNRSINLTYPSNLKVTDNAYIANKLKKIFLSDRQSGTIREQGLEFPCAPPATPTREQLLKYEYVPCLNDIRAQRAVKVRLEALEKIENKRKEKIREEKLLKEKQNAKDKIRDLKHKQRLEIYALNKVMTELEHKNFEKFCKTKGIKMS